MLQSTRRGEPVRWRAKSGASFLLKGSPTLLQRAAPLHDRNSFGFGDFVFRLPDGRGGRPRARPAGARGPAAHRAGREPRLPRRAQSLLELAQGAHRVRARRTGCGRARCRTSRRSRTCARNCMRAIHEHRRDTSRGAVADFDGATRSIRRRRFSRIGGGSLGGKARGLAFVRRAAQPSPASRSAFRGVRIAVPPAVVLATDVFDEFLERERAARLRARDARTTQELERRFVAADLPAAAERDLAAFARGNVVSRSPCARRACSRTRSTSRSPASTTPSCCRTITIGRTSGCGSC